MRKIIYKNLRVFAVGHVQEIINEKGEKDIIADRYDGVFEVISDEEISTKEKPHG